MELYVPQRGKLITEFPIFIRVRPHKRARMSGKRLYQPKDHELELELKRYEPLMIDQPMIMDIFVYFRRENEKVLFPVAPRFGDYDNLGKGLLDRMQDRGIITNDRFVIGGETWKQFAKEDYAVIRIYEILEDLSREAYLKVS